MVIVIEIRSIWRRYVEDSLTLNRAGVDARDVIKLAFGFACLSCQRGIAKNQHSIAVPNVFNAVQNLLSGRNVSEDQLPELHNDVFESINRSPSTRRSIYDQYDPDVYRIVDIVGEISHMLVDAVIKQLGLFPAKLILQQFIGKDLVLHYPEE